MPNPFKMKGFNGLYSAIRADINDSMRAAGAGNDLLQRFSAYLDTNATYTYMHADFTGREAVFAMAREAMLRDPTAAAALGQYTVNSPKWNQKAVQLFGSLPVVVKYMPGPNVIDVMMGKGNAMQTVITVG